MNRADRRRMPADYIAQAGCSRAAIEDEKWIFDMLIPEILAKLGRPGKHVTATNPREQIFRRVMARFSPSDGISPKDRSPHSVLASRISEPSQKKVHNKTRLTLSLSLLF